MARPLNATMVENQKADPSKRVEVPDGAIVGLYLVVQPSGAKSWAVRYRTAGKCRKVTLGPYPRLSLKDARLSARETLQISSEGGDPAGDRVTLAKLQGGQADRLLTEGEAGAQARDDGVIVGLGLAVDETAAVYLLRGPTFDEDANAGFRAVALAGEAADGVRPAALLRVACGCRREQAEKSRQGALPW